MMVKEGAGRRRRADPLRMRLPPGPRSVSLPARGAPLVPVRPSPLLSLAGGALAAALALGAGGWGLWRVMSVERAVATPPPPRPAAVGPELEIRGVRMVETKDGAKLWEVRADRVEVFERDGVTHLRQVGAPVEVVLYAEEGTLTATAREAVLDLRSKDVKLAGDVRGRSDGGSDLRTASLRWVAASRTLRTDEQVVLTRGGLVTVGRGMEAETNLERVRIRGGIASQIMPAPDAPAAARPAAGRAAPGRRGRG